MHLSLLLILALAMVVNGHDHFFQYANVPGWNAYEFGYNRGNHNHFTSRFEKAHGWTFKTKVRWGDKNGWGESYWDYNHADKGWKKGHGHQQHGHGWKGWSGGGQGSELAPVASSDRREEVVEQPIVAPRYAQRYEQPRVQRYDRFRN